MSPTDEQMRAIGVAIRQTRDDTLRAAITAVSYAGDVAEAMAILEDMRQMPPPLKGNGV